MADPSRGSHRQASPNAVSEASQDARRSSPRVSAKADGTNRAFWHERRTCAPRGAVWRLWTDVSTWKDWDAGLKDAQMTGAMQRGSTGSIIPLSGPTTSFEVTAFAPGEHYAFVTRLPLARLTVARRIVQDDTGGVVFRHDVEFSGLLGWLWAQLFGPGFRRQLPEAMDAIAQLAEGAAP